MLACGIVSAPLSQFIVQKLGGPGIALIDKKLDQACAAVLTLLNDHLNPATEHIIFRLGELEGLARWRVRFEGVGLCAQRLAALTDAATLLRKRAEEALLLLCRVRTNYSAFFRWLSRMANLLSDASTVPPGSTTSQDFEAVADFLHHDLTQDRFGDILGEEQAEVQTSIWAALRSLRAGIHEFGAVPGQALCSTFKVSSPIPLVRNSKNSASALCSLRSPAASAVPSQPVDPQERRDVSRIHVSILHDQKLFVLRAPAVDGDSLSIGQMLLPEDSPICADFYTRSSIAVLTSGAGGSQAVVLSHNDTIFQEVKVQQLQDTPLIDVFSGSGEEAEVIGTPYIIPTGKFNKIVALGSKKLCCAYAPPRRLIVFDPEPELEEDDEEDEDDEE